jgi:hypothetical protein
VVDWARFEAARPDLAEAASAMLYRYGVGLAFLATVRIDGGPRVHPMCPIRHAGGLYGLLIPSPKRRDLLRDGRFSMHSFPAEENEDACYLTGSAGRVDDRRTRNAVERRFLDERPNLSLGGSDLSDHLLFEFDITTCLVTRTTGHGDPHPWHEAWHADGEGRSPAERPMPAR